MVKKSAFKRPVAVISMLLVAVIVLAVGLVYWNQLVDTRNPSLYLLPQGYTGKVTIYYGQPDAPPLEREGSYIVYPIPESGVLKTSTPEPQYGRATDRYCYVDAQGNRTDIDQGEYIHAMAFGGQDPRPTVQNFFVGSRAQWEAWVKKAQEGNKKPT